MTHDSRWIKSDAEISHGHSGGMMLDQRGQLIAVTPGAGAERRQVAVLTIGAPEDVRAIVSLEPGEAPHGHVTWSPDGEWILFTTERDGNSEIYLAPASGAWSTNLTTTEFANDDTPA